MGDSALDRTPRGGDGELAALLAEMVGSGSATAAAAMLVLDGASPRTAIAGWRRPPRAPRGSGDREPGAAQPLEVSDRFDLASLSKPLHAAAALRWDASSRLPLATRLAEVWPQVVPALESVTLEGLLRHQAGFSRWAPLYARCGDRHQVASALLAGEFLADEPPGYSDLDYILWGLTVERALGQPLDQLVARELEELGPHRLDLLLDHRACVEGFDDGAHALGGADGCQASDTSADDQHPCGR